MIIFSDELAVEELSENEFAVLYTTDASVTNPIVRGAGFVFLPPCQSQNQHNPAPILLFIRLFATVF